jgi:hypothetical protein
VEIKICSKCKEKKNNSDFNKSISKIDGLRSECKVCQNLLAKKYREDNREKVNESHTKWKKNNPESYKLHKKNNLVKYKKKHKENIKKSHTKYSNKKYKTDLFFSLSSKIRSRVNIFLKLNNITKRNKTFDIVGCSPKYLKEYLEQKFTEGMSWELMGKFIHVDHIIPLSSAKTEEEIYKLCHYTNLQPLWAKDNMSKGSKIF